MDEAMKIIAFKNCVDLKAPSDIIICGEFGDIGKVDSK